MLVMKLSYNDVLNSRFYFMGPVAVGLSMLNLGHWSTLLNLVIQETDLVNVAKHTQNTPNLLFNFSTFNLSGICDYL